MFKVAIIQFKPVLGRCGTEVSIIAQHLAKSTDAELVVLPELALQAIIFQTGKWHVSWRKCLMRALMCNCCRDSCIKGQHIITGFNEKSGELLYNSSVLIGPEGIMGTYRKMHLFMNEKEIF